MRALNSLAIIIALLPVSLFAQSFAERAAEVYLQTDKNYDIDCRYSYNKSFKLITPVSDTLKGPNHLTREFVIETQDRKVPMTFTITRKNRLIEYSALINQTHLSTGNLSKREFYIAPIRDQAFASEFETSRIYCNVNLAYAYPHALHDGDYHISVHPHKIYDWQSRLKGAIETYLNDTSYNSIILLETGNYRGNLVNIHRFFDGMDYKLPHTEVDTDLVNVPHEVPLIVSPAGNNRFDFRAQNEINITFTGGNHNYCIWNATRHVIEGLMNSKSEAKVNFYYDMKSIVAQKRGVEGMRINFNRRDVNRSNLLKDLLSRKEIQQSYHSAWLNYFSNFLAKEYSGMYKTYKLNYKAEGYETSLTIEGNGTRNLEVNLTYL